MNFDALKAAFDPDRVSWRVGSTNLDKDKKPPQGKSAAGIALAYIDSRDVQERLDAVCGPENWQDKYHVFGTTMICEIGIKVGDSWIWKSDGAGSTDIEAEKGQISDSFKRAAVKWGVGRYLYEIDSPWVDIEPMGRSFRIKADQKAKLRATLVRGAPAVVGGKDAASEPPKLPADISHNTASDTSEDPDGQVKAWCDREISKLAAMTRLPEVLMWSDEREAELHRLQRKAPTMHRYLMDYFQKVQRLISEKAV